VPAPPEPQNLIPEIMEAMAAAEIAALGAYGLVAAHAYVKDGLSLTGLPCTVHWLERDEPRWMTIGKTAIGGNTPMPQREHNITIFVAVVIGKRDNNLSNLVRETARWGPLLDEKVYCENRTLGGRVGRADMGESRVIPLRLGEIDYLAVAAPIDVHLVRRVAARG
jgi:hypothetical protein